MRTESGGAWRVFLVFLRLGLTSFGGPAAHLGYFREEFVARRRWLSERGYAELVGLCQFLPGPASSQVGFAIGLLRAGYAGALAAWTGFTLPSAIALLVFARGMSRYPTLIPPGALHGLKVVAVAVVAQAVWRMASHLCTDVRRVGVMAAAAGFVLLVPAAWAQIVAIVVAAIAGLSLFSFRQTDPAPETLPMAIGQRTGLACLALFVSLLLGLPLLGRLLPNSTIAMVDVFYRSGSLVFGGGHVVLPLLEAQVVPRGWIGRDLFLAGYGAAQAIPGPLFTFAAFLGASMDTKPSGCLGGLVCLLSIYAPSLLLLVGVLPFWRKLRRNSRMEAALAGVNAAVVGLLLAALYQPVWMSAIHRAEDFELALAAFALLAFGTLPPWAVVLLCSIAGGIGL